MIEAWNRWRVPLSHALDPRYYNLAWLEWMVMNGKARFIANERAAAVAEIAYYPTGAKDLKGICAAGEVDSIVNDLIPDLMAWGAAQGCCAALIDSRPAWTRILRNQGFEPYKAAVRKAL